jgi:hypothetical protein
MAELGPDLEVFGLGGGEVVRWTIEDLLPEPFGSRMMGEAEESMGSHS